MTSQGHVTTASLIQANKDNNIERHFLSACISKSSAHQSLKLHTVNCWTLTSTMWQFDNDLTNSYGVIDKSFGVEEFWSYINASLHKAICYLFNHVESLEISQAKIIWQRFSKPSSGGSGSALFTISDNRKIDFCRVITQKRFELEQWNLQHTSVLLNTSYYVIFTALRPQAFAQQSLVDSKKFLQGNLA